MILRSAAVAVSLALGALALDPSRATAQDDAPSVPAPPADAPAPPPSASVAGVTVTARRPTTVSGVTVVAQGWCPRPDPTKYPAARDPAVADSYPARGAVVSPGVTYVRVSFDAAMTCDWDVNIEGGENDPCAKAGAWALPGRRTFVTRCTLAPKTHYVFHFRKTEGFGFVGLSGREAQPFDLAFDTSDAPPRTQAAPTLDPRPTAGETVKAYVTCVDVGEGEDGACQRAVIDTAPPETP
jgi:hypothetical protein